MVVKALQRKKDGSEKKLDENMHKIKRSTAVLQPC